MECLQKNAPKRPCDMQPELSEEIFLSTPNLDPAKALKAPPLLNSKTLEAVKALHETRKTFLVFYYQPLMTPREFQEASNGRVQFRNLEAADALWRNKLLFRAVEVDMQRFNKGKTNKIFREVQAAACNATDSAEKNLLSTFAVACLEPYEKPFRAAQTKNPHASRPKTVLFASDEHATHPQVTTFMAMMGCEHIGVANARLLKLLGQHVETQPVRDPFYKKTTPHLYDSFAGNKCGKSGKVGPTLKKCPCGKAYYCSRDCQKEMWPTHRADHNKVMEKKQKKKKKKTSKEASK